jgi:uncharacterized damage-inducible protein DinB
MPTSFAEHHSAVMGRLDARRGSLCEFVSSLGNDDLERARRGGWTIARVLEHIIDSEWHYARLVRRLRACDDITPEAGPVVDVQAAVERLANSRRALVDAVDGVSEDDFYRLATSGREEYSVVSVLENVEQHDIEHAAQLQSIHAEAT